MNKQLRNAILVALGALAAGTAGAKEGGDQYPNGIETWFAGAVPPPATTSSTTSAITAATSTTARASASPAPRRAPGSTPSASSR